jgi:putative hydrolase of the HAD superfamily
MKKKIRAITFDLDNTLWDTMQVIGRANEAFHGFLGEKFPRIASKYPPKEFYNLLLSIKKSNPKIAHDFTALRKRALEVCADDLQIPRADVVEPAFAAFVDMRSRPVFYPGVLDSLAVLKEEGFLLGAITNGNTDFSKVVELNELMAFCVSAGDVGAAKPDPAPFREAIVRCSTSVDEILHVGDDYMADCKGAKEMGFTTVWISDEDVDMSEFPAADLKLASVNELLEAIRAPGGLMVGAGI